MEKIRIALENMKAERDNLNQQITQLEKMLEKFAADSARMLAAMNGKTSNGRGRPKGSKNKSKIKAPKEGTFRATIVSVLGEYESYGVDLNEIQEVLAMRGVEKDKKSISVTLNTLCKGGVVKKGKQRGFWAVA